MPELPGVPAGDGGCAQACADRKVGGCGAGENGRGSAQSLSYTDGRTDYNACVYAAQLRTGTAVATT